jgi:hypothetical protein
LAKAKDELARALQQTGGGETAETKELKRTVDALTKGLDAERKRATDAATESVRAAEKARLKGRITDLEDNVTVKKEILEKLKAERDAAAKAAKTGAAVAGDVQRMRDQLKPQREMLEKVERQLMIERLRAKGITLTEPATNDAKLDLILKELAELRKEVQELKGRK